MPCHSREGFMAAAVHLIRRGTFVLIEVYEFRGDDAAGEPAMPVITESIALIRVIGRALIAAVEAGFTRSGVCGVNDREHAPCRSHNVSL
jgi:hypothetical protein